MRGEPGTLKSKQRERLCVCVRVPVWTRMCVHVGVWARGLQGCVGHQGLHALGENPEA